MSATLLKNALEPLPLGSIRPEGWIRNQLRIQADGLSGHLDEFWPDVAESGWIGGSAEGWEREPYWLDGVVPLAFSLDDERLKTKVRRWLDYILTHQHEDGWLGPTRSVRGRMGTHEGSYEYEPWPIFIVLKAMTQYQEATGDPRVIPAMERCLRKVQSVITEKPLTSWPQMRSADLLVSIYWLYRRTNEDWLLGLARLVQAQGYNWRAQYADFPYKGRQAEWKLENHVVNQAMAIKQPAMVYQLSHDKNDYQAVKHMVETLDIYHGQVNGIFTGDEVLAGKNPSQGTELCAVVEYMFSLETLLSVLGEPAFGDRLERIAFNALPATFKPDMWAHQYDQQANQIICAISEDNVYATNGPASNIFGLQPNDGCCTANMHQGWPKFASHLWMRAPGDGLAAVAYAACVVATSVAGTPVRIEVQTQYPFEDTIQLHISTTQASHFPLLLRIPAWANGATVTIDNAQSESAQPGTFHRLEREWTDTTVIQLKLPMALRTQMRYHNSVAIERGPLVYSLKMEEEWRHIRGELPHADWEVHPLSAWNYALEIDREHPERSCTVVSDSVAEVPFSPAGAPTQIIVKGRQVSQWTLEHNAAGSLPESPVTSSEPLEDLTLIPYGSTNLRVTEFPVLVKQDIS